MAAIFNANRERPGCRLAGVLALIVSVCASMPAQAVQQHAAADLTGSVFSYKVEKGDTLTLIGARFGAAVSTITKLNRLNPDGILREGQTLRIDNRHLVSTIVDEGIVVNVPQRMLFFFKSGRLAGAYPVTVGKRDWQTSTGSFRIMEKQHEKTWKVPLSIQEEMRREGQVVRQEVPPGPGNPLGEYWIRTSPSCGIHGTNAPSSIYSARSHGCLRMEPSAIEEMFPQTSVGMPVTIIYEPMLFGKIGDACYIEVNRDIYGTQPVTLDRIEAWVRESGLTQAIDWSAVRDEIRAQRGLARPVCKVSGPAASP